jgi:serine/threonine protein phosphatase PrpC
VKCSGKTHPGKVRDHNEDAIGWDENISLVVLADGMGGHASGEVASDIVRNTVIERGRAGETLADAIMHAHSAVLAAAAEDVSRTGMGATVVAARSIDGNYEIAWVGDSRAYLWRDQTLSPLTRDHSYLEWLITNGQLSEQDARNHPQRNIVTQSVGLGDPKPDVVRGRLHSGDKILLCSDGLNDELTDDEIARLCAGHTDADDMVNALVDAALEHGGRDNVSVIVAEFRTVADAGSDETVELEMVQTRPWAAITLGVTAAMLTAGLIAWFIAQ